MINDLYWYHNITYIFWFVFSLGILASAGGVAALARWDFTRNNHLLKIAPLAFSISLFMFSLTPFIPSSSFYRAKLVAEGVLTCHREVGTTLIYPPVFCKTNKKQLDII